MSKASNFASLSGELAQKELSAIGEKRLAYIRRILIPVSLGRSCRGHHCAAISRGARIRMIRARRSGLIVVFL
jgi:hypothetical protein